MMWPERPRLPRTHMYRNTRTCKHMHTHRHTKLPAPGVLPLVRPGSNIIISPPGWSGGIRGLQRESEGEKRPDLIPSCLETWLSWGRLFFGMQQTLWDPPPLPLFPSPHRPAAAALRFGLPTWTGIYCSLHHTGCLTVVWSLGQKKIGISMIHKPPLTPSTKQQPTSFKYTSLLRCWISLVKLCKHRKKVLIYLSFVLVDTLSFGLPAIPLTCGWLNATRALSHKDRFRKNCKKLSTFIHSTSSSFGQELYMSSVKFRTNGWLNVSFFIEHSYSLFRSPTSFTQWEIWHQA